MSLVEIARFSDVYEADLAAAFLESHGIPVSVTERHQTTIDPLMQRALGIRILGAASNVEAARDLLARARSGEFAEAYDSEPEDARDPGTRATGTVLALVMALGGGFWGSSLPRRLRPVAWQGIVVCCGLLLVVVGAVWLVSQIVLNPP